MVPTKTIFTAAALMCAVARPMLAHASDAHAVGVPADLPAAARAAMVDEDADAAPWTETIVTESDGVADDRLGTAVAISGDTAVMASGTWSYNRPAGARPRDARGGASTTSVDANQKGAVYVFTRRNGVWTQTQKLFASDAADYANFGSAVALEGSTLLVAALNANVGDVSQQGAVYAFARVGDTWTQTQKIVSSDGASTDAFGSAVALHGDTAVIGALNGHPGGNTMQGKAYVFTSADGQWTERQILTADDGASNDRFGQSAAFDGTTILIGAPTLPYNFAHAGWVYVFEESDGAWTQTTKLFPDDSAVSDQFGYAIALDGDVALISALGNPFAHGAVYAFRRANGAWTQAQKLSPADGTSGDQFGNAIALHGAVAFVGAQAMVAGEQKGTAYVLDDAGDVWGDPTRLGEGEAGSLDLFGSAVAFDGTTALVAAPGATVDDRASQGKVHFYAAPEADAIFCSGFDANDICGAATSR